MKRHNKTRILLSFLLILLSVGSIWILRIFNSDSYSEITSSIMLSLLAVMFVGSDYAASEDVGYYDLNTLDNLSLILSQNGYEVESRRSDDSELEFFIGQHRKNINHAKLMHYVSAIMCYIITAVILEAKTTIAEFHVAVVLFSLTYFIPTSEVFPSRYQKSISPTDGMKRYLPSNYGLLAPEDQYHKRITAYTNLKSEYCNMLKFRGTTENLSEMVSMIVPGLTLYGAPWLILVSFKHNFFVTICTFLCAFMTINLLYCVF